MAKSKPQYNAWNPGLTSEIPGRLMPQVTIFTAENSDVDYPAAKEAASFCGLKLQDMVAFKVGRLVVHEILIRVTADLFVPDGPSYEKLGLNLRSMAERILVGHVLPQLPALEKRFSVLRGEVEDRIAAILDRDVYARGKTAPEVVPSGFLSRLFGKKVTAAVETRAPELLALEAWQKIGDGQGDELDNACLLGLQAIVGGIIGQRGRLLADRTLIVHLASNWVCNFYGSQCVGEWITPIILQAVEAEGYRLLPYQDAPVVMNVKGASGAGKSTIRPLQRELAGRLGVQWQDFALVSPDYWRKFLLDYESLGDDFKYAAMLTGQELEIIDKKLDRYMEAKAARAEMPHLLIDRFRFDSFVLLPKHQADGRLLSRFGDRVFMFFMITPPPDTVERAWKRGITTGRYKAVDDLLFHNIEAYTGMPQLFFNWVNKKRQKIHFEFLDNSVAYGERPKTVAFGWNGQLTVLDMDCMRRLGRYRKINVEAQRPEDVFLTSEKDEEDILVDCIDKIPDVTFVDPKTLRVLGRTHAGKRVFEKKGFFAKAGLDDVVVAETTSALEGPPKPDMSFERQFTVGAWGLGAW
jgi:hypothetical protein